MAPKDMGDGKVQISVEGIADRLIRTEMLEAGIKRPDAEKVVARRAGVSPSAFSELRRGRLRNVERIEGRIRSCFVRFLERQIAALENELAIARASHRECDLGAVEAAIRQAKEALAGRAKSEDHHHNVTN